MARRRARLLEQERDTGARLARVERQAEERDGDADPRARRLLSLQAQAGNEAVSTMVVQRDEAKPADTGTDPTRRRFSATLTMDGLRAPQDVNEVTLASDSLSATLVAGPGVADLYRLMRANEAIKHAVLDIDNAYSVTMTDVHIAALQFSKPARERGTDTGQSMRELVEVKLVFEASKRSWKPRQDDPRDDWRE